MLLVKKKRTQSVEEYNFKGDEIYASKTCYWLKKIQKTNVKDDESSSPPLGKDGEVIAVNSLLSLLDFSYVQINTLGWAV